MKKLMTGMFLGAILGGVVGTMASDEMYRLKKKVMKKAKKMMK